MLAPLEHNDDYSEADISALKACVERYRALGPDRAEHLQSKLDDGDWLEVAEFCSYSTQHDSMKLKVWSAAPCQVDEDAPDERDKEAQRILRKMLRYGVSRFHPDPLLAIDAAKGRRKKRKPT